MWPFGKAAARLAAVAPGASARVGVELKVVSADVVTSPLSGVAAALLRLDLLERRAGGASGCDGGALREPFVRLGTVTLGGVLVLRDEDGAEVSVVVARAAFEPAGQRHATLVTDVPSVLVPFLRRASGRGALGIREFVLRSGDHVRLDGVVEPSQRIVADGYRSAVRVVYVVRDDVAPVVLTEVSERLPW